MSPNRRLSRARLGALSTFFLAGALCAVWTVRMPALQQKLDLSDAQLGLEVLGWGVGALITMLIAGRIIGRHGSRRVLRLALPGTAGCLALVGLAPDFMLLIVTGLAFGLCFGLVDVSMNTQASTVERRYGRPLMGGMHAGWSLGAVTGGLLGASTAWLGLDFTAALCLVAALCLPAILAIGPLYLSEAALPPFTPMPATPSTLAVSAPAPTANLTPAATTVTPDLIPAAATTAHATGTATGTIPATAATITASTAPATATTPAPAPARARRPRLPLLVYLFGAIVFCSYLAEGAVADWSGVYLRDSLGATAVVATFGYPMFEASMFVGRMCSDRLTAHFGARALITVSGFAAAAAFLMVVLAADPLFAVIGFALVGLGVCAVSPLAMSLSGAAGGAHTERAIATASTLGYSGLLLGPVSIGFVSAATSLRIGYAVVIGVCVAIAVGATFVPRGRHIEDRGEHGDALDRSGDPGVRCEVAV